uniref:NADH-ubiquinone oxidoreductase chain 2 n=1 Tax=Lythrypnus sp. AC-2023 TaxID=3028465 RepID=A0AA96C585_9GOBI|nr:NADH dehydrogenase subunit 2 [Lythrypnus sp. AC-2023]
MTPYVTTLLLSSLGLGTMVTFASSHWLLAWMGLELNTLAIIPLMARSHHPRAVEAATKYFLVQATAAAILLFASATNAWLTGQWGIYMMTHPLPSTLMILALALKLGLAPLHLWLPEVMQGLDLTTGLILATWQKLAPFALLLQVPLQDQTVLIIFALASTLLGGWGGFSQTQLRKIMAYSSVAHLGWMILVAQFAPNLMLLTLLLYLVMTSSAFLTLKYNKVHTVNSLSVSWAKAPALTLFIPMLMLSLAGLPPLSGFMPKWMILQELTKQELPITATLSAFTALLSLYFYLRLSYSVTLTASPNNTTAASSWRFLPPLMTTPLSLSMAFSVTLLPMTPSIMANVFL